MKNKKFKINYDLHLNDGSILKDKKINISKCEHGMHAQVRLEKYLKKNYTNFKQLIVNTCVEDMFSNLFGDILGNNNLNDIFKK